MNDAPQTLDRRIRADLERQIRSGAWPPGFRIPTEADLMAQYGCARMTVSKSISALVGAGLIERRKRAGSFVAHPQVHAAVLEIPDLKAVIEARGEAYAYHGCSHVIRLPRPSNADEALLGAPAEVLELEGVHFAHSVPFALERRLICLTAVGEAARVDFNTEAPGSWLLKQVPWTEAEHRISAVNLAAKDAGLLAIGRSDACLQVKRWTWRQGQGITYVTQLFPGALYDLVARFGSEQR